MRYVKAAREWNQLGGHFRNGSLRSMADKDVRWLIKAFKKAQSLCDDSRIALLAIDSRLVLYRQKRINSAEPAKVFRLKFCFATLPARVAVRARCDGSAGSSQRWSWQGVAWRPPNVAALCGTKQSPGGTAIRIALVPRHPGYAPVGRSIWFSAGFNRRRSSRQEAL